MQPDESTPLAGKSKSREPFGLARSGEQDGPFERRPLFVSARGAIKTDASLIDGFPKPIQVWVALAHRFSFRWKRR
jgi:hypothetical protein